MLRVLAVVLENEQRTLIDDPAGTADCLDLRSLDIDFEQQRVPPLGKVPIGCIVDRYGLDLLDVTLAVGMPIPQQGLAVVPVPIESNEFARSAMDGAVKGREPIAVGFGIAPQNLAIGA